MTDINRVVEKYKADEARLRDGFMAKLASLKASYQRKWQNATDAEKLAISEKIVAQSKLEQIRNLETK